MNLPNSKTDYLITAQRADSKKMELVIGYHKPVHVNQSGPRVVQVLHYSDIYQLNPKIASSAWYVILDA